MQGRLWELVTQSPSASAPCPRGGTGGHQHPSPGSQCRGHLGRAFTPAARTELWSHSRSCCISGVHAPSSPPRTGTCVQSSDWVPGNRHRPGQVLGGTPSHCAFPVGAGMQPELLGVRLSCVPASEPLRVIGGLHPAPCAPGQHLKLTLATAERKWPGRGGPSGGRWELTQETEEEVWGLGMGSGGQGWGAGSVPYFYLWA